MRKGRQFRKNTGEEKFPVNDAMEDMAEETIIENAVVQNLPENRTANTAAQNPQDGRTANNGIRNLPESRTVNTAAQNPQDDRRVNTGDTESTGRPHSEQRQFRRHNDGRTVNNGDQNIPANHAVNLSRVSIRDDNRSRQEISTEKPKFAKKPSSSPSTLPKPEGDWRTLMASMEEGRGGLKKKLKRLFIRDKV